jgi:hypothetical protein
VTDEIQQIEPNEKRAQLFEEMARQIRLNKDVKFGGAFVVVPPSDADPFLSLMLNQEEPAIFWSAIQTLAKIALDAVEKSARQSGFR